MENIVVAFSGEESRRRIARLLEGGGVRPLALCRSGAEVLRSLRQTEGGVAVCGFRLGDMTAGELGRALLDDAALLVVASPANLDLCQGENLLKVPTPVSRRDFFAALDLAGQYCRRHPPRPQDQRRREERKSIREAKALLMDIHRMTEAEAHRLLQKRSMDAGLKMAETAQLVIESYTRYVP